MFLFLNGYFFINFIKINNLKYIIVEVQGGGASGNPASAPGAGGSLGAGGNSIFKTVQANGATSRYGGSAVNGDINFNGQKGGGAHNGTGIDNSGAGGVSKFGGGFGAGGQGGGSLSSNSSSSAGQGGGAGGYAIKKYLASELLANETVTIGSGGGYSSGGNGSNQPPDDGEDGVVIIHEYI